MGTETALPKRLEGNGRVAVLVKKPRKTKACSVCHHPAVAGEPRYNVTWGGGGLGSLKFPSYAHAGYCVNTLVEEKER